MKKNKQAFTLTELLVVVVIIGILSAVVLPKFNKVLEGYKTAEAEHIMEMVRNEQEQRCMLGKAYTTTATELNSLPTVTSKHFSYALDANGITATRTGDEYELKIPSYRDGRICCNDGCNSLSKSYPTCEELLADDFDDGGGECTAP